MLVIIWVKLSYFYYGLSFISYFCRMNIDYDLKHPKKYFLVTIVFSNRKSTCGICHSWHPQGAVRTIMSAPSTQQVIGNREIDNIIVEELDEYESIKKDDFCVQTSKDGLFWIITNIADKVVYKVSKAPREFDLELATLEYLNDEPVNDRELKHLYRRKLYIWVSKYGRETLKGTFL